MLNTSIKNGAPRTSINGKAILANPTADPLEGKLIVSFNGRPAATEANYWVLDTDYDNYSIVWNCNTMRNGKSAGEWDRKPKKIPTSKQKHPRADLSDLFYLPFQKWHGFSHVAPP